MRINRVYISNYKNLKDFNLSLEGGSFVDVFVGKNGTGKSNFFEALLEIFRHLYEKDFSIIYSYKIEYEIEGRHCLIHWDWEKNKWFDGDGNETSKISKELLPDNILIYYSGHNEKIVSLIEEYEEEFKKGLKAAHEGDSRDFIGIGNSYNAILLTVLLLQDDNCVSKNFIKEKLAINDIGNEVMISLKRPYYAKVKSKFDVDRHDDTTKFWRAEGITKKFLNKLDSVKKTELIDGRVRDEGYIPKGSEEFEDRYCLYYDLGNFQEVFKEMSPQDLFSNLDNLKTLEMLEHISLELTLEDGTLMDVNDFSDGQFQSVYIYAISEIFKEKNCVTLLDEPDSFLHPEWQYEFLKQVFEISDESGKKNHMLLSSHSAITLLNSNDKKVNLFQIKEGNITAYNVGKDYAVAQLSDKMVRIQNDKHILSVIHSMGQNKPILFTEGNSDPIILKEVWGRLYPEVEMPFEISFGHGCQYLRLLLQNEKFLGETEKPVFGLFDFDVAWNEWNSVKGETPLIEDNPYNGIIKKVKDKDSYAMLIPIPDQAEIKKLVIKKDLQTFEGESKVEMEHLFYSDETKTHFKEENLVGGGKSIEISDSQKMKFATEVVPDLADEYFQVFKPMFDNMIRIIGS